MTDARRARRTTRQPATQHPLGSTGLSTNTGPLASAAWLVARNVFPTENRWSIEILLGDVETQFALELFAEEWGFRFTHAGKQSWIRVTDLPFVHGRDDHGLIGERPPLRNIGALIKKLESRHAIRFDRGSAEIRCSIAGAEPAIRDWLQTL